MAKIRYSASSKKSNISGGIFSKKRGFSVGDTGPGGGVIFYVNSAGFAAGPTLNLTHNYLEAAPTTGVNAWVMTTDYGWSANTTQQINYWGYYIGQGYKATLAMTTQDNTPGYMATVARAYRGPNNLDDWYFHSRQEADLLRDRDRVLNLPNTYFTYYTSTSDHPQLFQYSSPGGGGGNTYKSNSGKLRPIRSF